MHRNARLVSVYLCAVFVLGFVVLAPYGAAAGRPLAVWMWGSTVRSNGAPAIAKTLVENHVTDVLLLVRGTSGKAEYKSAFAPAAEEGRDALGEMIAACHPAGIKVHAWFVFNQDKAYADVHPEDQIWHHGKAASEFKPYAITDGRVCPDSKEHLAYTNDMIREVVTNYDVDGIHLDYIRYGHVVYCFCPKHVEKAARLGIDIERVRKVIFDTFYATPANPNAYFEAYESGDPDVAAWVAMRQQEIREAAQSMKDVAKSVKPGIQFSASLMPDQAVEASRASGTCHYSQSYSDAAAIYDFICTMSYHQDYGEPASWVGDVVCGAIKQTKGAIPVWAGIQAYGKDATGKTVAEASKIGLAAGADGLVFFQFGAMNDDIWSGVQDVAGHN